MDQILVYIEEYVTLLRRVFYIVCDTYIPASMRQNCKAENTLNMKNYTDSTLVLSKSKGKIKSKSYMQCLFFHYIQYTTHVCLSVSIAQKCTKFQIKCCLCTRYACFAQQSRFFIFFKSIQKRKNTVNMRKMRYIDYGPYARPAIYMFTV